MKHMRFILSACLLLAAPQLLWAQGRNNTIAGVWQSEDGAYIQIYPTQNGWFGRIVGSASGDLRYDKNNSESAQDTDPFLGIVILKKLKQQSRKRYANGTIYNPKNGKKYHASAEVVNPNQLEIRGFVGIALFGKTRTWHRVSPRRPNVREPLLHKPVAPGPSAR